MSRLRSPDSASSARQARPRSTEPPTRSGADRQVRALRLLPALLPDLCALGRGDGFSARPHLPDEGRPRGSHGDDAGVRDHFDACLGCMACVTSCPSGVQYAPLIEATAHKSSGAIRDRSPIVFRGAIFALFPFPAACASRSMPLAIWQASIGRERRDAESARTTKRCRRTSRTSRGSYRSRCSRAERDAVACS